MEKSAFDKIYFPKKPNYENVAELFASKLTNAQRNLGQHNNGDNIEHNVEITNYMERKKLDKTKKKLENKRNDYNIKRKLVQEQWLDLQEKEASLRENFIKFNQFVKENQEKTERAKFKIAEQIQLKEERFKRKEELLKKCEEITNTKRKMDRNIGKYRIYEDFLVKVVEKEDSIQNINDLLKRYEALIGARKELNDIQQRDMTKLQQAKSNLSTLVETYLIKINGLNNKVDTLMEKYRKCRQISSKWEKILHNIRSETEDNVIDIVAIKDSCKKIYIEICQRKKETPVYLNNVEKQLIIINNTIREYAIINKKVEEIEENVIKESVELNLSQGTNEIPVCLKK